jgi:hypothetical protein
MPVDAAVNDLPLSEEFDCRSSRHRNGREGRLDHEMRNVSG